MPCQCISVGKLITNLTRIRSLPSFPILSTSEHTHPGREWTLPQNLSIPCNQALIEPSVCHLEPLPSMESGPWLNRAHFQDMAAVIHCLAISAVLWRIRPGQHQLQSTPPHCFFSIPCVWPLVHFHKAVQIFFWWSNCTLKSGLLMGKAAHLGIYFSGKRTSPYLMMHIPSSSWIVSIRKSRSNSSNIPSYLGL